MPESLCSAMATPTTIGLGIDAGAKTDGPLTLGGILMNVDFNSRTFQPQSFSQHAMLHLFSNVDPAMTVGDINQSAGLPALFTGVHARPRPEQGKDALARWAEANPPNFSARGPSKDKLSLRKCAHCGMQNRKLLIPDFSSNFKKKKQSGKVYCRQCYGRAANRTPLNGRRFVAQFKLDRYNNRHIKLSGVLEQFLTLLDCDIRDIWAICVPCSGASLAPRTPGYRRRGALYFVHPWRVPFKPKSEASSISFFIALFRHTPLRAVSLFQLSISAYNIWNQDWAIMRNWGRFTLDKFAKRFTPANTVVHDAASNKRPSESALFVYLSPNTDDGEHGMISAEMACMLGDIMAKRMHITVILDSPTRSTYSAHGISAKTLEGMTKDHLKTKGVLITDADQLTWGILHFIVKMAREVKCINEAPTLNLTLQGSYIKAVRSVGLSVDGFRFGCFFTELVSAMMADKIPGTVQMSSFYDPCLESNVLDEGLAREEIISFRCGEWPPLNPSPIEPIALGCRLSLETVIDAIRGHPASFMHCDPEEYPPPIPSA